MVVVVYKGSKQHGKIPRVIARLLEQFANMMLSKLLKNLPPIRVMDHKIELVPGTTPSS